jgi:tetratricopeptide (TPR) repeat protein
MRSAGALKLNSALGMMLLFAAPSYAANTGLGSAEEQYRRADYQAAVSTLLSIPARTAAGYALLGKAYYMDGQYRNAIAYLEKAVNEEPRTSEYYDWLGRAYGRRAEEASFLAALPYARKTREAFEKAAATDPNNLEALGDLFEFYLQAPAIVGGGLDKAESVAAAIQRLNQAEYHYVRARLAEKRKNLREAESELRTSMELAPDQVGRVLDVATFLYKHGRYAEGEELFARAARMAPDAPKVVFAQASAYVDSARNLEQARTLLRRYAGLPITADDPPRSEVSRLLAKASR